jgi:hypothetical protein
MIPQNNLKTIRIDATTLGSDLDGLVNDEATSARGIWLSRICWEITSEVGEGAMKFVSMQEGRELVEYRSSYSWGRVGSGMISNAGPVIKLNSGEDVYLAQVRRTIRVVDR